MKDTTISIIICIFILVLVFGIVWLTTQEIREKRELCKDACLERGHGFSKYSESLERCVCDTGKILISLGEEK